METERETLETCVAILRSLAGIKQIDLKGRKTDFPDGADAKLVLRTNAGQLTYMVEVKRTVTAAGLDHLLQQLERYAQGTKARPLLLTHYIAPNLAERLVRAGINFADAAGNVYLNWPGKLHIQIQGKKPKQIAEAKSERISQASGLRVVYALLTQAPENWGTYREIAKAGNVALGSVAVVMRELKAKGYLAQTGPDQWKLTQKRKLLDLWVGGYSGRLRPTLVIGRYQPPETNLAETMARIDRELSVMNTAWDLTGGFAADVLTHHFRGEQLSFFAQDWSLDFTRRLKWLPSEQGPVTVLRRFSQLVTFQAEKLETRPVAHPLLVYAELIFQGRERELETARIVYDRYLAPLVSGNGR